MMTVSDPRNNDHGDQVSRFTGLFCTTLEDKIIGVASVRASHFNEVLNNGECFFENTFGQSKTNNEN